MSHTLTALSRPALRAARVAQELVDVHQARPGKDALIAHVLVFREEMMKQLGLERVARGKIAVTPFTRDRAVHFPVPESASLAETGPGGDNREAASGLGPALVEDGEILRFKHSDPVGVGLEIVNKQHAVEAQTARQPARIHHPG